jgi:mannan endo-1,6-alpha-mannosidase
MFDTLIQYWHLTGDSQYNTIVTQGLLAQQGPNGDYIPPNQTSIEGNNDQSTWALTAVSAAEAQFGEPQGTS